MSSWQQPISHRNWTVSMHKMHGWIQCVSTATHTDINRYFPMFYNILFFSSARSPSSKTWFYLLFVNKTKLFNLFKFIRLTLDAFFFSASLSHNERDTTTRANADNCRMESIYVLIFKLLLSSFRFRDIIFTFNIRYVAHNSTQTEYVNDGRRAGGKWSRPTECKRTRCYLLHMHFCRLPTRQKYTE